MKGKTLKKLCGSLIAVTVFITGLVVAPVNVMAEEGEEGKCTHEFREWVENDGWHYWLCQHCKKDMSDSEYRNHAISLVKEEKEYNHPFICYTYRCGICEEMVYGIYHVSTSENPTKCVNCGKPVQQTV